MSIQTARRMNHARRSFVREILKAAANPGIISFAGGLPNPRFIPVDEISGLCRQILAEQGAAALQYCTAEGHPPLRQWVADQYAASGLNVLADQIIITSGSQQGFDLLGKVLVEPDDKVIVEDPTYIAAIQAFGMYEPNLSAVPMDENGIDLDLLKAALIGGARILYTMPNFQNPTGISYSADRRHQVAALLRNESTVLVEDDPYHLLGFDGNVLPPIANHLPERTVLFARIAAISVRIDDDGLVRLSGKHRPEIVGGRVRMNGGLQRKRRLGPVRRELFQLLAVGGIRPQRGQIRRWR